MMHVLADDFLYMDMNGQEGSFSREEARGTIQAKAKSLKVAFVDCETTTIQASASDKIQKEALINAAFSQDYLVQEERLAGDLIQIIGAKKEKIKDVCDYFKPLAVESMVPYPVAIRAFLRNRALLPDNAKVVFLDDLKTQALVTIFEGLNFTAPRRISMRDLEYMVSEVRRSEKNYLSKRGDHKDDNRFTIVSNNREWLNAFQSTTAGVEEQFVPVDVSFPVLEGMKVAQFGMHFCLSADLVRRKKQEILARHLKAMFVCSLCAFIGSALYVAAYAQGRQIDQQLAQLQAEQKAVRKGLEDLFQRKFETWFRPYKEIRYAHLYYDFISNMPVDYAIKEFTIQQTTAHQWLFSGTIFPLTNNVTQRDFAAKGDFASAQLNKVTVNTMVGQKIDLTITQRPS